MRSTVLRSSRSCSTSIVVRGNGEGGLDERDELLVHGEQRWAKVEAEGHRVEEPCLHHT